MIRVSSLYDNNTKIEFQSCGKELANFINRVSKSDFSDQKEIRLSKEFKKYKENIQSFQDLIFKHFSCKCIYCGNKNDLVLEALHPIEENIIFPELAMDIDNIGSICRQCNYSFKVTYLRKDIISKRPKRTLDLMKKIPSIILPPFEPVHKYVSLSKLFSSRVNDYGEHVYSFFSDRLLKTIKVLGIDITFFDDFLNSVNSSTNLHNEKDLQRGFYEFFWEKLHDDDAQEKRSKSFLRSLEADYLYAEKLRRNSTLSQFSENELPMPILRDDDPGLYFHQIKSIRFRNVRCFNNKEINLENRDALFILGDNGSGKTSLLKLFSKFNSRYRKNKKEDFLMNYNAPGSFELDIENFEKEIERYEYKITNTVSEKDSFIMNTKLPLVYIGANRASSTLFVDKLLNLLEDDELFDDISKVLNFILDLPLESGLIRTDSGVKISLNGSDRIEFYYASSGVTSTLRIIYEIYKHIYRSLPRSNSKEKCGFVLVDEIELHMHPKWKYSIGRKLIELFPDIYFIFSTHDPLVLSEVATDNIIVLKREFGSDSNSVISNLPNLNGLTPDHLLTSPLFELNELDLSSREPVTSYRRLLANKIVDESLKLNLNYTPSELSLLVAEKFNSLLNKDKK